MFNKLILFVAAISCMAAKTYAQLPCSTDTHYQKLLLEYPQLAAMEEQFDAQVKQATDARTAAAPYDDTTIYDIPLVIHVIHDYNTADNISDDVLYQAAIDWAIIYVKHNADTTDVIQPFKKWVGNPKIRLHLATIDPNGQPTKGIVRYQSYLTINADDQAKFGQWPQNHYVNVWFINAFGAADAGAAAYAYFPSSATFQPYYDGVICLASYADYAKTVPHELGHVLNLYHPWGNSNNPGVACGYDPNGDKVDDTPPTKGHLPSDGCSPSGIYDTFCATGYMKTYTAHDGSDSIVNYPDTTNGQNIMDYTYCQRMFTIGQTVRMRTALVSTTGGRSTLFSPANLAATGALAPMPDLPPVADYIVNKATGGGTITDTRSYFLAFNSPASFSFKNWSWNDTVSSVLWTFSNGATVPTSTSMNTVNTQFTVPGWVTVSLKATSNAGSNTIINTNAVYAADSTPAGGLGYTQSFPSAAAISNWPMFNYYNNQFKWQYYSGAGYGDNSCVRYRSFDTSTKRTGSPIGDHDDFYTPAFNLTNAPTDLYLNFFTSASSISGTGLPETAKSDSLEIDVSTSGGERWVKIAAYTAGVLSNVPTRSTEFIPTLASQWVARSVNIPVADRVGNAYFRFRYWPGNTGNDMYLDNFSIGQFTAGVQEVMGGSSNLFNVFPNPATSGCNLVFKTGNDGLVTYTIKDLTGKLVYEHKAVLAPNAMQQENISRSATPSAGMYFITVTIDGVSMTQKLVVY